MRSMARPPRREAIRFETGTSFGVNAHRPNHWAFTWHDHPEIEFTLIEAGNGLRYVGDHVEPFTVGDCCLLGPLLPHTWTSDLVPGQRCASVVAHFSETVAGSGLPLAELTAIRRLIERSRRGLRLCGELAIAGAVALRAMQHCGDPLERLLVLWRILAQCAQADETQLRELCSSTYVVPVTTDPRLARVLAMIDARAGDSWTLDDAASNVGMTAPAFSRWFRRATGQTFVARRNAVRIGIACRLLQQTATPITSIAFTAGFGSLANFNRQFLAAIGCTPRWFRADQTATNQQ